MKTEIPTIAEKVAFLRQPASYPYRGCTVAVKETHMSWVFLVDGFVYKLKKPVRNRLVDFTKPDARLRNCIDEVELNRRLAKDIYIGVVKLVIDKKGALALEGKGEAGDWLVKMKRLPGEQTLAWQITHGLVNEAQVKSAASMLATFYQGSAAISMETGPFLHKIEHDIVSNCNELIKPAYNLQAFPIEKMKSTLLKYLNDHRPLFENRLTGGRVIETHGDLRPEHVFLGDPPAIIDCLEFNRDLRIMDIAEELSYLAMECEALGNEDVGKIFLETYLKAGSDNIPGTLIAFYKLKKALLRAHLVIRHIAEPRYKDDPKWKAGADKYLRLAISYL